MADSAGTDLTLGSRLTTLCGPQQVALNLGSSGSKMGMGSLITSLLGESQKRMNFLKGRYPPSSVIENFLESHCEMEPPPLPCLLLRALAAAGNHKAITSVSFLSLNKASPSINMTSDVSSGPRATLLFRVPILACVPADAAHPNVPGKSQIINLHHINVPHSDRQMRFYGNREGNV